MTAKLITSNYFFIQKPCNLFLRGIKNKRRESSIWPLYISLLSKLSPPEFLDSIQLSWKDRVNTNPPPHYTPLQKKKKKLDSKLQIPPWVKKERKDNIKTTLNQIAKILSLTAAPARPHL